MRHAQRKGRDPAGSWPQTRRHPQVPAQQHQCVRKFRSRRSVTDDYRKKWTSVSSAMGLGAHGVAKGVHSHLGDVGLRLRTSRPNQWSWSWSWCAASRPTSAHALILVEMTAARRLCHRPIRPSVVVMVKPTSRTRSGPIAVPPSGESTRSARPIFWIGRWGAACSGHGVAG